MSTSALTLRCPQRASRSTIQAGVFACGLTLRTMRPEKRPHKSVAAMCTGRTSDRSTGMGVIAGTCSGAPVSAATSRATPSTLRQCAKFGVSLRVNSVSSNCMCARMFWPIGASDASSSKPSLASLTRNSLAEHNMPWLSTPRNWPNLIRNGFPSAPGGNSAPTVAHGTRIPTRALGAPHTIPSSAAAPISTWQTRRRSALGCCATALISPTTTPLNGGATGSSASTSKPAMVSVSASCWVLSAGSQKVRSQDSGNCMVGK